MMTDDEIIAIAKATETAEPGTDGYILPVSFARAIENAVIAKLAVSQNALKDEIRLIWKPKCDALRQQLEAAQAENAQSRIDFKEMVIERNAELARLAEIEAGASPVEPSQAQPPAPSDAAIAYMTGYSDGKEWAATPQPKEKQ